MTHNSHGLLFPLLFSQMGTIQPIAAIAEAVRTARPAQHITFHCDTSQSSTKGCTHAFASLQLVLSVSHTYNNCTYACHPPVGKIPVNVETLGVDLATVAGHKIYSPKVRLELVMIAGANAHTTTTTTLHRASVHCTCARVARLSSSMPTVEGRRMGGARARRMSS